jgi:tRNA threonylcarbamoyladenosine biosynthesis protein TsaB
MILAIESASTDPSLALAETDGSPLAHDAWSATGGQGRELLPRLIALLAGARRQLADVRAVAVGRGPGSFTGLRAGMSLAKGLAVGLSVPLVGVPSLVAWLAAEPETDAALARAGALEIYLLERGKKEPRIVDLREMADPARAARFIAPAEVATALGLSASIPPSRAALAVAVAGADRLGAAPQGDPLDSLEPIYLRPPRGLVAASSEVPAWR